MAASSTLLAVGCEQADLLFVELPPEDGSQSLSLVINDGPLLRAYAYDRELFPRRISIQLEQGLEQLSLESITYASDLDALGFREGEQSKATSGPRRALTRGAHKVYLASLDEDVVHWREVSLEDLSVDTQKLEVETPSRCATPTNLESIGIPGGHRSSGAVVVDGADRVFVSTTTGWFLYAAGELSQAPSSPPELARSASFVDERGDLWLAGSDDLWRARIVGDRLEGELVSREPALTSTETNLQLFALHVDAAGRAHLLRTNGELWRFEAGTWTRLHTFGLNPDIGSLGAITELPSRDLLVTFSGSLEALTISPNGAIAIRTLEVGQGKGLSASGYSPVLGPVVGTTAAEFFHFDGVDWLPLGQGETSVRSKGFFAFSDGFLFGGDTGYFGQYSMADGFCTVSDAIGINPDRVAPFGDGLILTGGKLAAAPQANFVLTEVIQP